ncbi:MAG: TetR/AcrR family transcriptional regulator [Gammaproteobacteria bacterium]
MRYPPNQKSDSRKKIIKAARSVFANVGFDKGTIDQIMSEAGMTRGGFNKHFSNKTELLIEVVREGQVDLPEDISCHVGDILRRYLDDTHIEDKANACPLFTFPNDVAHHGDDVKTAYEDVAKSIVDVLTLAQPEKNKELAMALMAMCVGCMVVLNSCADANFKQSLRKATLMQISELTGIKLSM